MNREGVRALQKARNEVLQAIGRVRYQPGQLANALSKIWITSQQELDSLNFQLTEACLTTKFIDPLWEERADILGTLDSDNLEPEFKLYLENRYRVVNEAAEALSVEGCLPEFFKRIQPTLDEWAKD